MADFVLRVTPEVLQQEAGNFTNIVNTIKAHFEQVENISSKTKGYWQGEAGTRARESYASYQEDIQFIIKRLTEHPADMLAMAGIYSDTEQTVEEKNATLQTDLIV